MCLLSIQPEILLFLEDVKYKLSLSTRMKILGKMYNIKEKDIAPWMTKKLDNTLWFNRDKVCNGLQTAISESSLRSNNRSQDSFFYGFTEIEINLSTKKQEEYTKKVVIATEMASQSEMNTQSHSCTHAVNIDNSNYKSKILAFMD